MINPLDHPSPQQTAAALENDKTSIRKRLPAFLFSPLTILGILILLFFSLTALFAPLLPLPNPLEQVLTSRLKPPSAEHWLGTDQLGRDILSRIIYGGRISLSVGFLVVTASGLLGTLIGLLSGYFGGIVEDVFMRITDIFFAFPSLILAMAIASALGHSLTNAMIAIAAVTWPIYARLVRAQVLSLRKQEFIEAAVSIGAPAPRIMFRHILPNTLSPILVQISFNLGGAILTAAGLSFIGFGAQPPTPEWGVMISEGRQFLSTHSWLSTFPGIAIFLTVMAFNLIGDSLRDYLDPRLRSSL
jgi:peptide/nickel transport system permease protein